MIRLTVPDIDEEEIIAVTEVLKTGYLVQGKKVTEFENSVAKYVGTKYAVAVTNCTSALQLALLAVNVLPGDYVFVTAYSWISTANVIVQCGAYPVFVDIEVDTFNMDSNDLKFKIEEFIRNFPEDRQKLKAVIPVHTFGQMANMPIINQIAKQYDLKVIEDAACALGSSMNGKMAGSWGHVGCFSFHPRKAITTGEGGIITTSSSEIYEKLVMWRNHGLQTNNGKSDFHLPGYNCRMTEIQAAIGIVQMNKLEKILEARREKALIYNEILEGKTSFQVPKEKYGRHIFQSYVIVVPKNMAEMRNNIIINLRNQGVEATIGTIFIPGTKFYSEKLNGSKKAFPIAEQIAARSISLPLYSSLSYSNQLLVIQKLTQEIF